MEHKKAHTQILPNDRSAWISEFSRNAQKVIRCQLLESLDIIRPVSALLAVIL
jgi:hypothetical protein